MFALEYLTALWSFSGLYCIRWLLSRLAVAVWHQLVDRNRCTVAAHLTDNVHSRADTVFSIAEQRCYQRKSSVPMMTELSRGRSTANLSKIRRECSICCSKVACSLVFLNDNVELKIRITYYFVVYKLNRWKPQYAYDGRGTVYRGFLCSCRMHITIAPTSKFIFLARNRE
jgi:hypothetical protein